MILVDHQISELCDNGLITPCDRSLINPASLDLRIGETAIVEYLFGDNPEWSNLDLSQYSKDTPYWLQPKEFMLVGTLEAVKIPNDIVGELKLKSSRAREGYDNALAFHLDPGYQGVPTLERHFWGELFLPKDALLINQCRYTRLPLYPGMLIGQIIFHSCTVPNRSYQQTGAASFGMTESPQKCLRYNGAISVERSKG